MKWRQGWDCGFEIALPALPPFQIPPPPVGAHICRRAGISPPCDKCWHRLESWKGLASKRSPALDLDTRCRPVLKGSNMYEKNGKGEKQERQGIARSPSSFTENTCASVDNTPPTHPASFPLMDKPPANLNRWIWSRFACILGFGSSPVSSPPTKVGTRRRRRLVDNGRTAGPHDCQTTRE